MIIGHKKQWRFLKKSVELGKISHAYLFYGQEKIGKKTIAFEFIKILNCKNPIFSERPCQTCSSCEAIQKSLSLDLEQHPDLAVIEPKKLVSKKTSLRKEEIQISQIRDLNWRLSLHSFSSPYKAAIIDRAHTMNQEAQSCFLKTLEEPRGNTVLILITEYPEMLLPTIRSRIQKIKFNPVEKLEIDNFLKSQGVSEEKAEELISFSFGKPGLALDFLRDLRNFENYKKGITELLRIMSKNATISSKFNYIKDISLETKNLKELLGIWLRYFRAILLSRIKQNEKLENESFSYYPVQKLESIINNIQNTIFLISKTNINPKLALEILTLEF